MKLLARKFADAGASQDASPQRADLRNEVWKMIALLREAKGGGVSQEFARILKDIDAHGVDIQKGLIAWIHLLEVLVQEAERSRRRGGGPRKKAQVKSAVFHLLTSGKARLPGIPTYLYPLVMDCAVEWTIEALVQVENSYALWDSRPEEAVSSRMVDFAGWLKLALTRVWEPVVGFLITAYTTIKYREPLNPELRKAVADVETRGMLDDKHKALASGLEFLEFLAQHPEQAIAGIKLIFEAVHMAESFLDKKGAEKKRYAHDLIVATLEDLGFPVGSGIIGIFAGAFIDSGIEAAWSIFKQRAPEAFKSRSGSAAAAGVSA